MATLKEFLKADRFATCAGVELLEIKPGYARACMEVTDRHLNGGGVCQGGASAGRGVRPCSFARTSRLGQDDLK